VFPSPVVILSIVAVAMAAFAFVATRGAAPTERLVRPAAAHSTPHVKTPKPSHTSAHHAKPRKPIKPAVVRGAVNVEVFNNSGITGLAGRVATRVGQAGWQVIGSDNWYGTIPATTIYYPPRLNKAAHLLALDLGVRRVLPAVDPMKLDRVTLILTSPLV